MVAKITSKVRRLNSLKLWSAITGVALVVALVLTFLPIQVSVNTDGLLSIDLNYAQANPGWPSGYGYRKSIPITGTSGAEIDWQVRIQVNSGIGSDSNGVVYLGGNCTNFPNDIRFTDGDSTTELAHWCSSNEGNSTQRYFFVNVADNLSTNQSISIYYGKSGATSASNGPATFPSFFCDDWLTVSQQAFTPSTGDYDAFGLLIDSSDGLSATYYRRLGTSHVSDNGAIYKRKYTYATKSWDGNDTLVYSKANLDVRNIGGGRIGSRITLFLFTYNFTSGKAVSFGYINSEDEGSTWGSYIELTATGQDSPYGHIVATDTAGTYLCPYYHFDSTTPLYQARLVKTTDSGATWSIPESNYVIYSGTTSWSETCVEYTGSGKMVALSKLDTGGYVEQSISSDNGQTWSALANTNLGDSTGGKISWVFWDSVAEKLIMCYMERNSKKLRVSEGYASGDYSIYTNATYWGRPYDSGGSIAYLDIHLYPTIACGYPSIVKAGAGEYFIVHALDTTENTVCYTNQFYYRGIGQAWYRARNSGTLTVSGGLIDYAGTTGTGNADGDCLYSCASFNGNSTPVRLISNYKCQFTAMVYNYPQIGFGRYSYAVTTHCAVEVRYSLSGETYDLPTEDGSGRTNVGPYTSEADHTLTYIKWRSGNVHFLRGTTDYTSTTTTPASAIPVSFGASYFSTAYAFHIYGDWFAIGKYTTSGNEPTVGTAGGEEEITVGITNTPNSKDFGILEVNTTSQTTISYFTLNNTGNCPVDITIQGTNMTGGGYTWVISGTATPGNMIYGLKAGLDDADDLFDVVVNTTANAFVSDLPEATTQAWGLKIWSPMSYDDGNLKTGNVTLAAVAS